MALDKDTLKFVEEELTYTRSIREELTMIAGLSVKAKNAQKIAVNLEKDLLERKRDERDTAGQTNKLLDLQLDLVRKQSDLLKLRNASNFKAYARASRAYQDELIVQQKIEAAENRQQNALNTLLGKAGLGGLVNATRELNALWEAGAIYAGLGLILMAASAVFKVFRSIDDAAEEFRMQIGMGYAASSRMYEAAKDMTIEMMRVGVNAEIANKSLIAVTENLFSAGAASRQVADSVALMKSQFGVAVSTSSEFIKSFSMISGKSLDASSNIMYFSQALAQAAGVPIGKVMEDVSAAAKNSYQFVAKTGLSLIKASVDARRMGTSIESATKSSASLLNFTQNVKDEMEASVLVGKSINLQRARELAYQRDIKGLNNEILKIMEDVNFNQLDPFQQDAVAKALGKSAGELAEMAAAAKLNRDLEHSTNKEVQKNMKEYKEYTKMTEKEAADKGKILEKEAKRLANQAKLTQISNKWNSIIQQLSERFLPKIAAILDWVSANMDKIIEQTKKWAKVVSVVGSILVGAGVIGALLLVAKLAMKITGIFGKGVSGAGGATGGFFGRMITGLGNALKGFPWSAIGKLAVGMALIAGMGVAVAVLAWGFSKFAGVKWADVFIGLGALASFAVVTAILGAGPVPALVAVGELVIAGMGVALAVFAGGAMLGALAMKMLGKAIPELVIGLKSLNNVGVVEMVKITAKLAAVTAALAALGALGPLMIVFAAGMAAVALGISPFIEKLKTIGGLSFGKVPSEFKKLVDGIKPTITFFDKAMPTVNKFIEAFQKLSNMNFDKVVSQFRNISTVMNSMGKNEVGLPQMKVDRVPVMNFDVPNAKMENQQKMEDHAKLLSDIKEAIGNLSADMKNGSLTANVYIDSQKLDALMGRRLAYTGQLV